MTPSPVDGNRSIETVQALFSRSVVCMTTHDRVDCAYINQEIIKLNYGHPLRMVHACSSPHYTAHLEDKLVRCDPKPLKDGALNLLRNAIECAMSEYAPEFIVHLEADPWLLDEAVLAKYLIALSSDASKVMAASSWSEDGLDPLDRTGRVRPEAGGLRGRMVHRAARAFRGLGFDAGLLKRHSYATQFFVIRSRPDVVRAVLGMQAERGSGLEASLYAAMHGAFTPDQVVPMPEREPVQPRHRYWCHALDLYCQHWPATGTAADPRPPSNPLHVPSDAPAKREALLSRPRTWKGKSLNRLLHADDTAYYNPGAKRY